MDTQHTDMAESHPNFIAHIFKPLSDFTIKAADWTIDGWVPRGQITLLAADGGSGKTTAWGNIVAAISSGGTCILDPDGCRREPQLVAVFSGEDSIESIIKPRLMAAGADPDNIITMDVKADKTGLLRRFKLGSDMLAEFVRTYRPALCVLDPIQSFVPVDINMGSRNAMRDCMEQLIALGEEIGTTFVVVCHTNKRTGASGRNRVSDSSDLWDIARSVIMMGNTEEEGVRYISQEKSNYGPLQDTVLVSISEGTIQRVGTTHKRDQDYAGCVTTHRSSNKSAECREFVLRTLREAPNQRMRSQELVAKAKYYNISQVTLNRVRADLVKAGLIGCSEICHNGTKAWYVWLCGGADAPGQGQLVLEGVVETTPSQV